MAGHEVDPHPLLDLPVAHFVAHRIARLRELQAEAAHITKDLREALVMITSELEREGDPTRKATRRRQPTLVTITCRECQRLAAVMIAPGSRRTLCDDCRPLVQGRNLKRVRAVTAEGNGGGNCTGVKGDRVQIAAPPVS